MQNIRRCPFQFHIDWSTLRLGVVLIHLDDDGWEFVVVYANWSNNKIEAKYNLYEGQCLIVVWAVFSFHCYLYGSTVILVTNHQPLKFLMESYRLTGKLAKWALILQEYDFDIVHKVGKVNWDVDGLSHNPSSSEEDTTSARWHGEVDLEAMLRWHAFAYLCTLLGCYRDVPQGNMGGGNSQSNDDEPKGNNALNVHLYLLVIAYLQACAVSVGLTSKEWDWVVHRAKWF